MASNPPAQPPPAQPASQQGGFNMASLGNALKTETGDLEPMTGEHVAQLLIENMDKLGELAKQGKLTQKQMIQLKAYADKYKPTKASAAADEGTSATLVAASSTASGEGGGAARG